MNYDILKHGAEIADLLELAGSAAPDPSDLVRRIHDAMLDHDRDTVLLAIAIVATRASRPGGDE
jgi:hypothetical protein